MLKLILPALLLVGCQTAQQKSEGIVRQRVKELKHLSTYKSTWCEVDTELTEPARARYESMFPNGNADELSYAWRARERSCEITPLHPSPLAKNYQAFLENSLCLLMQVHYINSPFDELDISAGIEPSGEQAHIRAGDKPDLGMFLPPDRVSVETRTRRRGTLRASYALAHGTLLPDRLEQVQDNTQFVIDEIEYESTPTSDRPMLKSFWISVGTDKPLRHSKSIIRDCRPL